MKTTPPYTSTACSGFTLIEVIVSASIFMLIIAASLTGMMHLMLREGRHTAQLMVDGDAHRLAAFLRTSLRLTDARLIQFHPPDGPPYEAFAYPLPSLDTPWEDDAINWGRTVILHPHIEGNRRRLMVTQLDVYNDNVDFETLLPGTHSRVLAETDIHLPLEFNVRPESDRYDFYGATPFQDFDARFGGIRLLPGENTLRFTVVGKRSESDGFGLRLDRLRLSPAGLPIEAEALFPAAAESGAVLSIVESTSTQMSDRRYLSFPAQASNDWVELDFYNDTWHETLFRHHDCQFENSKTVISEEPGDVGVHLVPDGRALAWLADFQAGNSGEGASDGDFNLRGTAVRVVVRGSNALGGGHVLARGEGCVVQFRASDWEHTPWGLTWRSELRIQAARIAEAADPVNPTSAIDPATTTELRFGDPPVPHVVIGQGETAASAPCDLAIDPEKSYVISYWVNPSMAPFRYPYPWVWNLLHATNRIDSYVMPKSATPSPSPSVLEAGSWDDHEDLLSYSAILGVGEIRTTLPAEAVYVSPIMDTRLNAPEYLDVDWDAEIPAGGDIEMRLRSGTLPDLSDAPGWDSISAMFVPGAAPIGLGQGRYLQARATLLSAPDLEETPFLRSFTVRWPGPEQVVDIGAVCGKFPEGGIAEVTVNDTPPTAALQIDLDLSGKAPSIRIGDNDPVRSAVRLETKPRN